MTRGKSWHNGKAALVRTRAARAALAAALAFVLAFGQVPVPPMGAAYGADGDDAPVQEPAVQTAQVDGAATGASGASGASGQDGAGQPGAGADGAAATGNAPASQTAQPQQVAPMTDVVAGEEPLSQEMVLAAAGSATTQAPYRIEWVGDSGEAYRPSEVIVYLQRSTDNGATWEYIALAQVVKENVDGTWASAFTGLSSDGGVKYRVAQGAVDSAYETTYSYRESGGVTTTVITNTLRPYGTVTVSLALSGETDKAKAVNDQFKLRLTGVDGDLKYSIQEKGTTSSDVLTAPGGVFTLKRGQSAVFSELPHGTTVRLQAQDVPAGYSFSEMAKTVNRNEPQLLNARLAYRYGMNVDLGSPSVTLKNRTIARGQFRFSLYDVSDLPWDTAHGKLAAGTSPTEGVRVQRAVNEKKDGDAAATSIGLSALALETADADKLLRYALVQEDLGVEGYTYDDAVYYLVGKTSADTTGDGAMTAVEPFAWYGPKADAQEGAGSGEAGEGAGDADVSYERLADGTWPTFVNEFNGKGTLEVKGEVELRYGKLADQQFEFAAYALDADSKPASIAAASLSETNGSTKNNAFGEVEFSSEFGMDDVGKTRYLLVTQVMPVEPDAKVTYDRTGYLVAVTVSDASESDPSKLGVSETWYACTWDDEGKTWTPGSSLGTGAYKPTFANELARGSLTIAKSLTDDPETQGSGAGKSFTFKVRLTGEGAPGENDDDELNVEVATASALAPASAPVLVSAAVSAAMGARLGVAGSGASRDGEGLADEGEGAGAAAGGADGEVAGGADVLGALTSLFTPGTAYADTPAVRGTGLFGTDNSVRWMLYEDNSLVIEPANGTSGNLGGKLPWGEAYGTNGSLQKAGVKSIVFKGNLEYGGTSLAGYDGSSTTNSTTGGFSGCEALESIDLSGLSTTSVKSMRGMFAGCKKLERVVFGDSFDTSAVDSLAYMFYECEKLQDIQFGAKFNTSSATTMSYMFSGCKALAGVDLSGFDTTSVKSFQAMFSSCTALTSLDLRNFVTSKADNMHSMFSGCNRLESIEFGTGFTTAGVTSFSSMFYNCSSLTELDVSAFDTSSGTALYRMFSGCTGLRELNLQGFKTTQTVERKTNYGVEDIFTGTTLSRVTFGDSFTFHCQRNNSGNITENITYLPLSSYSEDLYTGKWAREDQPAYGYTPADLSQLSPAALEGTWVWQLQETAAVVEFDAGEGSLANGQPSSASSRRADTSSPFSPVVLPTGSQVDAPEGFELKGWTLSADGSGQLYTDSYTPTTNATVTLHAQYRQSKPTKSADGWWTVSVTAGEQLTIKDLPDGVTYEVYEQTEAGWKPVSVNGAMGKTSATGTIEAGEESTAAFTNKYEVGTADVTLRGDVTLDGAAPGEPFDFTLGGTGVSGAAASAASNDAGGFSFAPLSLKWDGAMLSVNDVALSPDETDGKVYTLSYTVGQTLKAGDSAALVYDTDAWTATFTVTVPAGEGSPAVSDVTYKRDADEKASAAFANTISKQSVTVNLAATGSGPEADFPITVTLSKMRKAGFGTELQEETISHTFKGSSVEALVIDNVPVGTEFQVVRGELPGAWVADDAASSGLSGTVVAAEGSAATVGYKYDVAQVEYGPFELDVRTTLSGGVFEKGKFSFQIVSGSDVLATAQCVAPDYSGDASTNDDYGVAEARLALTDEQMKALGLGEHVLTVRMADKSDTGITYDEREVAVTVKVEDAGDGTATYTPSYADGALLFENSMKPATLKVTKVTRDATEASKDTEFTFEVALARADDADAAISPEGVKVAVDGGAAVDLVFSDGVATFSMAGAADEGKTAVITGIPGDVRYTVTERKAQGWSAVDGSPVGNEGTTEAGQEYEARFTNAYATQGTASIVAEVTYDGRRLQGNDFSFRIWHSDSDGHKFDATPGGGKGALHAGGDSGTGFIQENANAADGKVSFIRDFDAADAREAHYFLVEQVTDDGRDGVSVTYDKNAMLVKVELTDNGKGGMTPTFSYWKVEPEGLTPTALDAAYVFRNGYLFSLPLTGGAGDATWLLVVGLLVAAVGCYGLVRRGVRGGVRGRGERRARRARGRRHAA